MISRLARVHFDGSFQAVPTAIAAIRREVLAVARSCDLDPDAVAEVALAVSEAATNAIVHGYRGRPGTISVSAHANAGELTVTVEDEGSGIAPRTDSPGPGLGLPIIASVTQRLEVANEGGGTQVRMVFPCPAAQVA